VTEAAADVPGQVFPFRFDPRYRPFALAVGVTPATAHARLGETELDVRFGPWRLRTPLQNVADVTITGPYSFLKTAGPAHLSFGDRGITFATNGDRGVCVAFREPVPGIEPTGRLRHPGATLTVADVDGFAAALTLQGALKDGRRG